MERKSKFDLQGFKDNNTLLYNGLYDYSNSVYDKNTRKITYNCPIHGERSQRVDAHSYGTGCYACSKIKMGLKTRHTKEESIEQAKKLHNNFFLYDKIDEWHGKSATYLVGCPIHGYHPIRFDHHLEARGCKYCGIDRRVKALSSNKEDFIKKAIIKHGENNIDYSQVDYINCYTDVILRCKKHGNFQQVPNGHLNGNSCPNCANSVSKSESEVQEFIGRYIEIEKSNRKILKNKFELDIVIPSLNVAIEYNGLYYHSDKFADFKYHLNKTEECKEKGMKLIHIFEDEWEDKKEIVKSRLLNIIGKTPNKIYARKCEIKEISSKESNLFLEQNHIQGNVNSKIRIGLFYNNDLVSLMTFGGLRKNLGQTAKEGSYELLRFCNKLNTNVVGGASKLLKYFENNYNPTELISYADRRWSTGDLYTKLNFKLELVTKPNYFYVKGKKRLNRFNFRKDILIKEGFDKNKTEKQIMEERGYYRIYDCGALKFKKEYNN